MTRAERAVRFGGVGLLGVAVQLAAITLLADGADLHYALATPAAVGAALVHNFLWHRRWTWRDRQTTGSAAAEFGRFVAANGLVSLAGNTLLMALLVGVAGLATLPANVLSIAACTVVNFHVADSLVFQRR